MAAWHRRGRDRCPDRRPPAAHSGLEVVPIPLVIELAAVRLRSLSPGQILSRLDSRTGSGEFIEPRCRCPARLVRSWVVVDAVEGSQRSRAGGRLRCLT
jgi:hypothetical protein